MVFFITMNQVFDTILSWRKCVLQFLRKLFWRPLLPSKHYLFKINYRDTRKKCEICAKLTIRPQIDGIDVFLLSLLLTLNIEKVNVCLVGIFINISLLNMKKNRLTLQVVHLNPPSIFQESYQKCKSNLEIQMNLRKMLH